MNIAIVGCGFVADYYLATLPNHPDLRLIGVTDHNPDRAARFAAFHDVPKYDSLDALRHDDRVELVLNLTNPRSHFEVTRACLEAGKHVYTEKPLAMELEQARTLVELAEVRGLGLASAPCSLLGETAQTVWKALRERQVGTVRLVYAELDDGMVFRMPYRKWASTSGTPWPAQDEFEVGCTFEHAGYYLTWLPAFFGPARTVTAFSACLVPDKQTDEPLEHNAPDFSVACITFASGVVARLTCSIIAPHDHSIAHLRRRGRPQHPRLLVLSFPGVHPAADHDSTQDVHASVEISLSPGRRQERPVPLPGVPADGLCPGRDRTGGVDP